MTVSGILIATNFILMTFWTSLLPACELAQWLVSALVNTCIEYLRFCYGHAWMTLHHTDWDQLVQYCPQFPVLIRSNDSSMLQLPFCRLRWLDQWWEAGLNAAIGDMVHMRHAACQAEWQCSFRFRCPSRATSTYRWRCITWGRNSCHLSRNSRLRLSSASWQF